MSRRKKGLYIVRIGMALGVLLLVLVALAEISHRMNYGHFFSYGVHVHTMSQQASVGIPGIQTMYAVQTFNYTLLPLELKGCEFAADTSPYKHVEYRYHVQRLDLNSGDWVKVFGIDAIDCEPSVTTRTWPLQSIRIVDWEATAARKGLRKGDTVRFVVFAAFNLADREIGQSVIASQPFTIEEEVADASLSYRVKH
jgi:hypothetical protein